MFIAVYWEETKYHHVVDINTMREEQMKFLRKEPNNYEELCDKEEKAKEVIVHTEFFNVDLIESFEPCGSESYHVVFKKNVDRFYYTTASEVARACQFTEEDLKSAKRY